MNMTIEGKLSLNKFLLDEQTHITVDQEICATCTTKYCLTVCPAKVYVQEDDNPKIVVNHAGCLECGTCIAACEKKGLTWNMPAGGMGISFRYA